MHIHQLLLVHACRSEELAPLALRSGRVQLVAPASGTTLWADLWTVPAGAGKPQGPSPLLPLWFELPLQPARCAMLLRLPSSVVSMRRAHHWI